MYTYVCIHIYVYIYIYICECGHVPVCYPPCAADDLDDQEQQ